MSFSLDNNRDVLNMLHNSPRFGAPNEAVDNSGVGASEFDSTALSGEYFVGIFAGVVIMGIFTLIWLCALPCAGGCCKEKCCPNQLCAKVIFFFCLFWSIIGFFISFGGIGDFKDGNEGAFDTLFQFATDVVAASNDLEDIVNIDLPNLEVILNEAGVECGNAVENELPDIGEFEVGLESDDVISFFGDFDTDVAEAQEVSDAIILPLQTFINGSIALTIIYLLIFITISAIAFTYEWKKTSGQTVDEKGWMAQTNTCNKTFGCPIFMCCGIILSLATVSIAGTVGVIATIGADQCVPSLREDILALASGQLDPDISELCGLEALDGASEEEKTNYFICHYLTCNGEDLFLKELGIDKQVVNGEVELTSDALDELIDELVAQINVTEGNVSPECEAKLDELVVAAESVVESGLELLEFVTCENLTPLWVSIFDEAFCNQLIAGLGVTYISWLLGAIGLMFALLAYPAIVFPPKPIGGKNGVKNYVQPPVGVVKQAETVAIPEAAPIKA